MKLYSIGFTIHATAYIKADSVEEALRKAKAAEGDYIEASGPHFDGRSYSSVMADEHAEFTLSPAMTLGEPGSAQYIDIVYDDNKYA